VRELVAERVAKAHGRISAKPLLPAAGYAGSPRNFRRLVAEQKALWRKENHHRLFQARVEPAEPGPVAIDIALTTGPGRNWASLWKPVLDSLGPILRERSDRPFHPDDDRIVIGLHHSVDPNTGHDVIIAGWRSTLTETLWHAAWGA